MNMPAIGVFAIHRASRLLPEIAGVRDIVVMDWSWKVRSGKSAGLSSGHNGEQLKGNKENRRAIRPPV